MYNLFYFRSLAVVVLVFLFTCSSLYAQEPRFTIAPRVGYGVQNLDWSIAGNLDGTSPNVFSELIWDQIQGMNYGIQGTIRILPKLDIVLEGDYQKTRRGSARDTDYDFDNRTGPFYDERFSSDEGYFYNFRVSARYVLPDLGSVSPRILLGYEQLGNELFLLPLADGSSDPDVRTIYQTDWYGGQMALELAYAYDSFYALGSYGFGLFDYKAKANWNLRDEFQQPVSFRHSALGLKHNGVLRLGYQVHPAVAIELSGHYTSAFTNQGLDELYTRNEGTKYTRLNGANLSQYSGSLGLRFTF